MLKALYHRITPQRFEADFIHYRETGAALEYCLDTPYLDKRLSDRARTDLRRIKQASLDALSIHGPKHGFDPASKDRALRQLAWRRTMLLFEAAEFAEAEVLVFHSSYNPFTYGHDKEYWVDTTAAFWERAMDFLPGKRIKVVIENIFDVEPMPLARMLHLVGHDQFGLCFDVGHFHVFCKNLSFSDYLAPFADLPFHMHLHDNAGHWDEHLPPGEGTIRFAPLLTCLRAKSRPWTLTLECNSPEANERGAVWVRERLGTVMNDPAVKLGA